MATKTAIKPTLDLSGGDGEAYSLLGAARKVARRAGWSDEQWQVVNNEAKAGDYDHLLQTLMKHFDVQ